MRMKSIAGAMVAGLLSYPSLAGEPLPWSYDGLENGQDMWGELRPDYAKCEIGTAQSPVVIAYTSVEELKPLTPRYKESKAQINFIDYTVDVVPEPGNMLVVDGTAYALKHIQFHSPSEHMVLDLFYPLEIHLLHESADGKALNLAIFAEYGATNQAYAPIASNIPGNDAPAQSITLNPAALLPTSLGYYAYTGSMSRPPCTEGVEWRVLKRPVALSRDQISALQARLGRNARLEQPVYTRIIKETTY